MTDETAWLIERNIHSQLHYWAGRNPTDWRSDHMEALRFARQADAELMLTYHCDGIGRVVEHKWCTPTLTEAGEVSRSQTALEEAARHVIDVRMSSVWDRDGRQHSMEDDRGEKLWLVQFEALEALARALSLPAPDGSSAAGAAAFDALEAAAKVADVHADGMRTLRDAAQQSGDGLQAEEHHNAMRISEFIAKDIRALRPLPAPPVGDGR